MKLKTKLQPSLLMDIRQEHNKLRLPRTLLQNLKEHTIGDLAITEDIQLEIDIAYDEDVDIYGDGKVFVTSKTLEKMPVKGSLYYAPHIPMIGADPEFAVIQKIPVVNLSAFKSADNIIRDYCDHCLGEIRPTPSFTAEGLVDNIKTELTKAYKQAKDNMYGPEFIGASKFKHYYMGFHIHFSIPQQLLCMKNKDMYQTISNLISILDSSVGLVSRLAPDSFSRRGTNEGSYGKLGDYKLNMRTLEYRVPSSFWLKSPELCSYLLNYSYRVFRKALGIVKRQSNNWKLPCSEETIRANFNLPSLQETQKLYSKKKVDNSLLFNLVGREIDLQVQGTINNNWNIQ